MDIVRSLTYVLDDPDWLNKLLITAIVTALSALLTPVFVGLLGWAALLGYMIELVRNVRLGDKYPMPNWNDFNRYLSTGFNVLAAFVIYSLPNLAVGCTSTVLAQNLNSGLVGSTMTFVLSCCLFPILLVYSLVTFPLLALGIARYSEDPRLNVFFDFNFLFETLRQNLGTVVQWWLAVIVVDLVLIVIGIFPLLGWVFDAALVIPVYGMLIGQFGLAIFGGLKNKPAPPAPAPIYRR